jgi:hypothetical protein
LTRRKINSPCGVHRMLTNCRSQTRAPSVRLGPLDKPTGSLVEISAPEPGSADRAPAGFEVSSKPSFGHDHHIPGVDWGCISSGYR